MKASVKGKISFVQLKEYLEQAASRGVKISIRTPFYTLVRDSISPDEVDDILIEMRKAGTDYYRDQNEGFKARYGQ